MAARQLNELAEWSIDKRQVQRISRRIGQEMQAARQQQLTAQETASKQRWKEGESEATEGPSNPPTVVAVEMDGGRFRARREDAGHGVFEPHWREMKAGCLLRVQSEVSEEDPHPTVPKVFLDRPQVQKLVRGLHSQHGVASSADAQKEIKPLEEGGCDSSTLGEIMAETVTTTSDPPAKSSRWKGKNSSRSKGTESWRPRRLMRTCVATQEDTEAFGPMLAAEAQMRGFQQASRKAFIADGAANNWTVQQRHFPDYVPIVDFVHLLSYVYAVAMVAGANPDARWNLYTRWIHQIWQGDNQEVHDEWRNLARQHEIPDHALEETDPRRPLQRGLTYLGNNLARTDYPRYRRLGLPVTSTLVESLIKEFNYRVKGTEKFWDDPSGAESILLVRAAILSEDDRFDQFFAQRPGCRYRRRSTLALIETPKSTTAA